jgi:TRAP-type C4-dicarboxylate transport system substrate-binding protein
MLTLKSARSRYLTSAAFLVAAATLTSKSVAADETHKFSLAGAVAAPHASAKATEFWAERVKTLSGGKIQITSNWGGGLLPSLEIVPGVSDGRVDLGHTSSSWHPEMHYTYLTTMPFLVSDGEAAARAMNELYATNAAMQAEYKAAGVHLLSFLPLDVVLLGSRDKIDGIEKLKGKQMRATGDWQSALTMVGAQPVSIPYAEIYESLERGVVDGYGVNFEAIFDVKLHEVAKNIQDVGVGQVSAMTLVISDEVWSGLSDRSKEILNTATSEMLAQISQVYADVNRKQCEAMKASGTQFISWSAEEKAKWRQAVGDTLVEKWAAGTSDKQAALDFRKRFVELTEKYSADSKWKSAFEICSK